MVTTAGLLALLEPGEKRGVNHRPAVGTDGRGQTPPASESRAAITLESLCWQAGLLDAFWPSPLNVQALNYTTPGRNILQKILAPPQGNPVFSSNV
jgi:hypothetical protein